MYSKEVAPERRTLRTVFRDTFSSRTISLIDLPLTKRSRLIRAIVSTTNIPPPPAPTPSGSACTSQRKGGQSWTPITPPPGSIFHAETHLCPARAPWRYCGLPLRSCCSSLRTMARCFATAFSRQRSLRIGEAPGCQARIRRIPATVALPVPTSRAVRRMPVPSASAARTAASRSSDRSGETLPASGAFARLGEADYTGDQASRSADPPARSILREPRSSRGNGRYCGSIGG